MSYKTPYRQGFTLIELLIFMSIFSVVVIALTDLFSSTLEVRRDSEAVTIVRQDSGFIMARLTYDISRASALITPSAVGSSSSSLQITINGINYNYTLANGNLTVTDNIGTDVLNSPDTTISNVSFTRIGSGTNKDTIQLSFTTTSKAVRPKGYEVRTIQTTVSPY